MFINFYVSIKTIIALSLSFVYYKKNMTIKQTKNNLMNHVNGNVVNKWVSIKSIQTANHCIS